MTAESTENLDVDRGDGGGQTVDAFHFGAFHVVQPKGRGHRSGMDAMMLAACVSEPARPPADGLRIADLGAGAGAAGLAVIARLPEARVDLIERSSDMAGFARATLALSENRALAGRARVIEADVTLAGKARVAAGLADDCYDHVIMNPPFNEPGDRSAPDLMRADAHRMPEGMFPAWIRTAGAILKPGGQMSLIARPQSVAEIIEACGRRFGGLELTFLHPRQRAPAIRLLVTAIKGSRARPSVRFPLVLHDGPGHAFAAFVKDLNNGRAVYRRA